MSKKNQNSKAPYLTIRIAFFNKRRRGSLDGYLGKMVNNIQDSICEVLGLKFNPFVPASATEVYFFTQETREILEEFYYGIVSRKGFMLLLGEVGVGKTSLLLQLLKKIEEDSPSIHTAWVFNTSLGPHDFLMAIAKDFGIEIKDNTSISTIINELYNYFLTVNKEGGNCAILVDEAHNLPFESLETLRMLSNLEGEGTKLVQIVLAGQPELETRLNTPELRQLRSRIYIFRILYPFSERDTELYISYKLSSAGSQIRLSRDGKKLLYRLTGGNPRLIHLVMDRVLHILALTNDFTITKEVVTKAARDIARYNIDIKARLSSPNSRRRAMFWIFLIITAISMGVLFSFYVKLPQDLFLHFRSSRAQVDRKKVSLSSSPPASPSVSPVQKGKKYRNSDIPVEFRDFLKPMSLLSLYPCLKDAVGKRDIEIFSSRLPQGMVLLYLKKIPLNSSIFFSYFPWKKYTGEPPPYLVLWRPPFHINKRYPASSPATDKLAVQKMLKDLGYYKGSWDGKFGRKTLQAIKRFQQRMGLPVTDGLDDRTLFWICIEYEKMNRKRG